MGIYELTRQYCLSFQFSSYPSYEYNNKHFIIKVPEQFVTVPLGIFTESRGKPSNVTIKQYTKDAFLVEKNIQFNKKQLESSDLLIHVQTE